MRSPRVKTAQFSNGNQARVLQVSKDTPIEDVIDALLLPPPRAVLVCNGGTAAMEPALEAQLARTLQDGLARVAAEEEFTVVTGGTDAGIFHLLGQGFGKWGRPAACIGVAVADLVTLSDRESGNYPLEPHHSHFVLVEGRDWGDETETMYALVARLADGCPSLAVFASGGEIALREMQANLAQERDMVLLAGSGRLTDTVLEVRKGHQTDDDRILEIARSGKIVPHDIGQSPSELAQWIGRWLQTGRDVGQL